MTYYRLHDDASDPRDLLDPDNQWSEPWGAEDEEPRRCDKCQGTGRTTFFDGSERTCPACRGTGTVHHERRAGVSVFGDVQGLLAYMLRRDADMDGCLLVELEGEPSDDVDVDADEGALLVHPTEILDVREFSEAELAQARDRAQARR